MSARRARALAGEVARHVRAGLEARARPELAPAMAAYLKTDMPFFGVTSKGRDEIAAETVRAYPVGDREAYEAVVLAVWAGPRREEKLVAVELARRYRPFVSHESIGLYERLIREGAWWDLVDDIAIHLVGAALLRAPAELFPVMDRWVDDGHMWVRRSAILCQNKHRATTDEARLFGYCLRRAAETEFFIRKAIGWALREYSYTAPDRVVRFVAANENRLSGLSRREALKRVAGSQ